MIGRTRWRIREPRPRVDRGPRAGRQGLLAALVLGAAPAMAQQPTPPPPSPPPPSSQQATPPDDDFIEFLGGDDVGDEAWWEFLKKVPLKGDSPPAPPQDQKQ